jgi:hypothetical protein
MPDQMPSASPRFSAGNAALSSVQRGERGRAGEDRDADEEHPPAPEAVAQRRPGEQEDRERERVAVDRPLQVLERRAEVAADARQRRRDDEVVERDHEDGHRSDGEGDDRAA